jgi:hypothetical protein
MAGDGALERVELAGGARLETVFIATASRLKTSSASAPKAKASQ